MTTEELCNQVSYKTNVAWFDNHNNVQLAGTPNKYALSKEIRQFLIDHEHDGIEVTLKIIHHCECEVCRVK